MSGTGTDSPVGGIEKHPFIESEALAVTFRSGQTALQEATFRVERGEFVSIVGPSGCGKSTLLRAIAGLIEPTGGRLSVGGQPPAAARRHNQVGFVFQDPTLLPWRTVAGNIRLPLELQKTARERHGPLIAECLGLIGLTEQDARKRPRMLSGGMRMRVSLARALVTSPELLLFDEPFAALDDILRQQLNEDLLRIWAEQRWTAVFVTHNVAEAVFLTRRILVMTSGPGRIAAEIEVPFDYPRSTALRAAPDFARLCGDVSARLREGMR